MIRSLVKLAIELIILIAIDPSNRDTVIVVKRFFSLAKTIVVDVFVIYISRIPLWDFWYGEYCSIHIPLCPRVCDKGI